MGAVSKHEEALWRGPWQRLPAFARRLKIPQSTLYSRIERGQIRRDHWDQPGGAGNPIWIHEDAASYLIPNGEDA